MDENEIMYEIRGACFEVFRELGPGLLESVYVKALKFVLEENDLDVEAEVDVPVFFKQQLLGIGFRIDLLVENKVIIELKSVKEIEDVHKKQLLTYLKLSNKKLGLLVNFNCKELKDRESMFRIINGTI
ncbi:MAG TPA: GxxExxY protein [Chitinophagales bacterium]|nr:GxxExxY protein [Chitinophagales bacterium]